MALTILHQGDRWIAVHKPSGQMVIPGRGESAGLPLNQEIEQTLGRKIFVVHRLDRGASGVVLFAKTPEAHRHASMAFESREVHKIYRVLVQGKIDEDGVVDQPLQEFGSGRMGVAPRGKESVTAYRVMETFEEATLLEVFPHTGRRHQIRAHLFSIGHPVIGDPLYGKNRPVGGAERLMLHALELVLRDLDGQELRLRAELPSDFEKILNRYRRCQSGPEPD
jgi:tRNA pseudouridine32 synthase / 23S rRNA pseudouridine746 synthase